MFDGECIFAGSDGRNAALEWVYEMLLIDWPASLNVTKRGSHRWEALRGWAVGWEPHRCIQVAADFGNSRRRLRLRRVDLRRRPGRRAL